MQRVVPDAQLKDVTYALARQIADGPQIPVRMIKRLVYQSLRLDLRTHLDLVSSHMSIVRQTADHAEGRRRLQGKAPGEVLGALALRVVCSSPRCRERGGGEVGSLGPRCWRPPRAGRGWAPSGTGRTVVGEGNESQGPHLAPAPLTDDRRATNY